MQELLQKAISIAYNSHKNQYNVNGEPYILHPMRIMLKTKNEEQMIIAVLHDVIEKSDVEEIVVKSKKAEGTKCPVCWKISPEQCERPHCPQN